MTFPRSFCTYLRVSLLFNNVLYNTFVAVTNCCIHFYHQMFLMAETKESEKKYTAASITFKKTLHLKPLRSLMKITQLKIKWKQPI